MTPDLPLISFPGKIHLIQTNQQLADATDALLQVREFGFDTETKPSFRKGDVFKVALLQLSTDTDAYLLRLHGLTEFSAIKRIFENRDVLKAGVAIRDDLKQLKKIFPFEPQNFIELQDMAKSKGLTKFGLKGMAEESLNSRLSKGPKLTNWEAQTLTDQQQMYAATDAWIGLQLYRKMALR